MPLTFKPRNVRPSFVSVNVDGVERCSTGPKGRAGNLMAHFAVRDGGNVLPLIDVRIVAEPDGKTVTAFVFDMRTGATLFQETFTQ